MRSRNVRTLVAAPIVALTALAAHGAAAQSPARHPAGAPAASPTVKPTVKRVAQPAVRPAARAAISADSARAIALARVKGATVTSERLRTRKGHQLYLINLSVAGQKHPVRATVDATSGAFMRLDGADGAPASGRARSGSPAPRKPGSR